MVKLLLVHSLFPNKQIERNHWWKEENQHHWTGISLFGRMNPHVQGF